MAINKAKLTTLPRIFTRRASIQLNCICNPAGFLRCPSVPNVAIARAVPTGGPRYYCGSPSCRCIRMRELCRPGLPPEGQVRRAVYACRLHIKMFFLFPPNDTIRIPSVRADSSSWEIQILYGVIIRAVTLACFPKGLLNRVPTPPYLLQWQKVDRGA